MYYWFFGTGAVTILHTLLHIFLDSNMEIIIRFSIRKFSIFYTKLWLFAFLPLTTRCTHGTLLFFLALWYLFIFPLMFSLISNTLHSKNTKKLKQHTYFFSFRLLRIVTSGFVTDFFVIFTPTATLRLPLLLTDSPLLLIYFLRCRTKFIFCSLHLPIPPPLHTYPQMQVERRRKEWKGSQPQL